jgi:hypothetical protein
MKIKIVIFVALHCVIISYIKFAIVKNLNINLYIHQGFISTICNGCVGDDIHKTDIYDVDISWKIHMWNRFHEIFHETNIKTLVFSLHKIVPDPVPEIIDPVFAKTSQNARFLLSENERFGLVFVKTGSINSGTAGSSSLSLLVKVRVYSSHLNWEA